MSARSNEPEVPASTAQARQGTLLRISNEIVRAIKQHFGKGPERAKSYMMDDLLFIVMRGGVTVAEQTMLDSDHENLVRNFRQQFENEMGARLIGMVEELTGRTVVNYQSQILFDPDIVLEIFVFDRDAGPAERKETAAAIDEGTPHVTEGDHEADG
jgi:uncharacterized protein YbcI